MKNKFMGYFMGLSMMFVLLFMSELVETHVLK